MTIQLSNYKQRLQALLPESEDLQNEIRCQVLEHCPPKTRELIAVGSPSFFKVPVPGGQWQTAFCLHFSGLAFLCHSYNWEALYELCKLIYQLTGIEVIYVRGTDLCQRCYLENGEWVREAL